MNNISNSKSFLLECAQNQVTADMEEYHILRCQAVQKPTKHNIAQFQDKKQFIMKNFKLSENDLQCLNEEYDLHKKRMFEDKSPF